MAAVHDITQFHDLRALHSPQHPSLAPEPLAPMRITLIGWQQGFGGDPLAGFGVGASIDDGHATLTERFFTRIVNGISIVQ